MPRYAREKSDGNAAVPRGRFDGHGNASLIVVFARRFVSMRRSLPVAGIFVRDIAASAAPDVGP
jgi:hypothetical protein